MTMPALRLVLDACKRRDAEQGLQGLEIVHAAIAPLLAGRDGTPTYDACLNRLKEILFPPAPNTEKKKTGWFAALLTAARPKTAVTLSPAEESFIKAARSALRRK